MIKINALSKSFPLGWHKEKEVLHNLSFTIKSGERIGIIGSSGCGKSTLARLICGLLKPTKGSIHIKDKQIVSPRKYSHLPPAQLIFQNPQSAFDPKMTILSSLMEPVLVHKHMNKLSFSKRINQFFDMFFLDSSLLLRYPHQISGGESQRIALIRALLMEPQILILDEATAMLDASTQALIFNCLMTIQKEKELTLIIISHDIALIESTCQEIILMEFGKIVEKGSVSACLKNPQSSLGKKLVSNFYYFQPSSSKV